MNTFSLIGCGKVGTSLARRLVEKGFQVNYIFNRTPDKAIELSREIGGKPITELEDVSKEEHWIIISVADDRVAEVSQRLQSTHALLTHTSGVLPSNAIGQSRNGYFYPLQSFSTERSTEWSKVPLFIEANAEEDRKSLREIAALIGGSVHEIDAEQKKHLHLAAVFINNFTNHMLVLAERIAQEKQLDFSIFHALLQETVDKAIAIGPKNAQTGPAIRGDEKTIEQHISLLPEELKDIYRFITNDIQHYK
jgi:predicted short-subunit dehydrogenase-like oxidoreductase (DUF2520 family)